MICKKSDVPNNIAAIVIKLNGEEKFQLNQMKSPTFM